MQKIKQFFWKVRAQVYSKFVYVFRLGYRSPVTFKMKLSVTTVNSSFHLLHSFCHKEPRLKCCMGLILNIVTSIKLPKDMRRHLPWSSATLGNYEKLTRLDTQKIYFQRCFCIRLSFFVFNNKWTKWNYQLIDTDCDFL